MREDTIYDLFFASLCGTASMEQQAGLVAALENDQDLQQEYVEYIMLFTRLYRREGASVVMDSESDRSQVESLLMDLRQQEQDALSVEIEKAESAKLVEKINNIPSVSAETNKFFRAYNVLVSIAAVLMFLFIIYAELFPPKYFVPVATVAEQVGAKWNNASQTLANEERVMTNQAPFILDKGIVKLKYDEGVDVLVEGPSKFRVEKNGIDLSYGRLYSYVDKSGRGFTVDTPNSRFVDLGTEFGIYVDDSASAELHVLKGEVQYFSGLPGAEKASKVITRNNAIRFDASTAEIQAIPVANEMFARHVDSKTGLVWRGQENLDLVKIAAGKKDSWQIGDAVGIHPVEAKYVDANFRQAIKNNNHYNSFEASEFIDGVFIPDGGNGEVTITSAGDKFACPDTGGGFTNNICLFRSGVVRENSKIAPVIFNGKNLEDNPESIMCLHSNCGITFDLEAIRTSMPGNKLSKFRSLGGISEFIDGMAGRAADVDVFILVDGQIRYKRELLKVKDGTIDIDIDLAEQDRFLTFIVTDGLRETDASKGGPWSNDFFYLVNPEIVLE